MFRGHGPELRSEAGNLAQVSLHVKPPGQESGFYPKCRKKPWEGVFLSENILCFSEQFETASRIKLEVQRSPLNPLLTLTLLLCVCCHR